MPQIIVLNPAEMLLKSFFREVVEPAIIMKGAGVLYMGPGGNKLMGFPPEHAFNMNPNVPDHPMWSHDPHTGDLLEGGMHPIDGALYHLQEFLDKHGIKGAQAEQIIQQAIDDYNRNHTSDNHHLPPFNSPEWRKLVIGPHPTNVASSEIASRGKDGKLFTHYGNRGGAIGLFPESGAIPFYKELEKILTDMGLGHARDELEFVKYPNISAQHLASNVYRTKKGELSAHGIVPAHVLQQHGPEGALYDAAHGSRHTWELVHHLPPAMFAPGYAPRANSATLREMNSQLTQALASISPSKIPNIPIQLHDGTQMGFREAMSTPKAREMLINDMVTSAASQFMFAGAGSPATRTKTREILGPLMGEENIPGFDMHSSHSLTGTAQRGRSPHSFGAKLAAAAAAHGPWEEDASRSALANNPHGLKENVNFDDIARRRTIIEAMADVVSAANGHQRWTPDWDNLPTEALASRGIGNLGQILHEQVPDHFSNRFYTDLNIAPMAMAGVPTGMGQGPSVVEPKPAPPPAATPPPAPAPQAAIPSSPAPTIMRPQTPALVAARQHIGAQPSMEERQRIAEDYGLQVPQHHRERFLQTMGDPAQTFLSQWMKSETQPIEMIDRIEKAMEELQLKDAIRDDSVIKYLPNKKNLNFNIESDVSLMAQHVGLTKHDIRSIIVSKGDWHRVADIYQVSPSIVGAVKVVFS